MVCLCSLQIAIHKRRRNNLRRSAIENKHTGRVIYSRLSGFEVSPKIASADKMASVHERCRDIYGVCMFNFCAQNKHTIYGAAVAGAGAIADSRRAISSALRLRSCCSSAYKRLISAVTVRSDVVRSAIELANVAIVAFALGCAAASVDDDAPRSVVRDCAICGGYENCI